MDEFRECEECGQIAKLRWIVTDCGEWEWCEVCIREYESEE